MPEAKPFFPYRTWSISSWQNWELQERTVRRALTEAPRHQISCIEIQDYVSHPCWDAPTTFRSFPKLAQADKLTYSDRKAGAGLSRSDRLEIARRLKDDAKRVRDAGYELQVWYHCLRDRPKEAFEWYPELKDADGEALYRYLRESLEDMFEFFPEISGLTVTSLHETTSLLHFGGKTSQADRMYRLYSMLAETCAAAGRRLILRDFIVRKDEFDDFIKVIDRLPNDVIIQTKDVLADWSAHEKPINPYLFRYLRQPKKLVVEFELANNYTGEIDLPWSDPEQIWRHIRTLGELGGYGAVGRVLNASNIVPQTIFDSPNEVNVWAFSRTLLDPGRMLTQSADAWWHDYDHMDLSIWTDWAKLRFGDQAASEVIHVLAQTPQMVAMTLNMCGAFFMLLGHGHEGRSKVLDNWVSAVISAVERCGAAHARSEKAEAARIVADGLKRIKKLQGVMPAEGYANVYGALDRAKHIVAMYQAAAETFLRALDVDAGRLDRSSLLEAGAVLRAKGKAARKAYGDSLFMGCSAGTGYLAEYFENIPGRTAEIRKCTGMYGR